IPDLDFLGGTGKTPCSRGRGKPATISAESQGARLAWKPKLLRSRFEVPHMDSAVLASRCQEFAVRTPGQGIAPVDPPVPVRRQSAEEFPVLQGPYAHLTNPDPHLPNLGVKRRETGNRLTVRAECDLIHEEVQGSGPASFDSPLFCAADRVPQDDLRRVVLARKHASDTAAIGADSC